MQFDDNLLTFKCPKHDPWDECVETRYVVKNIPLYHPHSYEKSCALGEIEGGNWFYRAISFYGPFLAGVIADLRVSVLIYKCKLSSELQTLFEPAYMESRLLEMLTNEFGQQKFEGRPDWVAPHSWEVNESGDIQGVKVLVRSSENIAGMIHEKMYLPIADDVMLCFSNGLSFCIVGNLDTQLETRDIKPLQELSNQILSSVSVKLSKQSKEQLAKAQAQFPNSKFSDHVAPLGWASAIQNDE